LKVYVSYQALFIMNLHAHLFRTEIIGFISGYYIDNQDKKCLFIEDANIVEPLESNRYDRTKSVEMEPNSSHSVSHKILNERGMQILGWYHSHPTFDVCPSNTDIWNHQSYQEHFNRDNKPFIGLIVGPYYKKIDSKTRYTSLLKLFHLETEDNK